MNDLDSMNNFTISEGLFCFRSHFYITSADQPIATAIEHFLSLRRNYHIYSDSQELAQGEARILTLGLDIDGVANGQLFTIKEKVVNLVKTYEIYSDSNQNPIAIAKMNLSKTTIQVMDPESQVVYAMLARDYSKLMEPSTWFRGHCWQVTNFEPQVINNYTLAMLAMFETRLIHDQEHAQEQRTSTQIDRQKEKCDKAEKPDKADKR